MDDVRIFTGTLIADLVLPGARTLKERGAPLQALIRKLRNHALAVAQVGPAELTQRAFVAVSAVSGSAALLDDLLDGPERRPVSTAALAARLAAIEPTLDA